MSELTCSSCGRTLVDATHHAEEWRDRGHRPQVVRELNPLTEALARSTMTKAPGR